MLYHLFSWLHESGYHGTRIFQYISFRSAMAFVLALFISVFIGKYFIQFLKKKQIGESVRDLGLAGQSEKAGTPTMGGLIIIAAILIPVLLLCNLTNIYIILMIFTTIWLGILGFADDYIKVFKKNKDGLSPRKKLIGQIILGLLVGATMYFHPDAMISEKKVQKQSLTQVSPNELLQVENQEKANTPKLFDEPHHSSKTTIPFVKNHELDYSALTRWMGDKSGRWSFLLFIPIIVFIIAAVSNGANLTDGLDGLATGTTASIAVGIAILAYVSGNVIFANYLNIMYIPNIGELVIFISAVIGACIGFYWWNCYPAQVFMGDTGSLTLGGIVAVSCIIIRKELLIPILCGVYLAQSISVIMQVSYFKYTKKRYGEGRRIFLMAPLHHHFQKKGLHESKIVQRFIVVSMILAVLAIVTLKVR
ncbi:MAG: phospho-N-acetylmuramoyl-pentapeptide-transferase [Bacteroidales bacterium]|nr:phospho-N-acetylmuramoyl-pentapeptide-transferase [Bacteroidales bacterium]MDD6185985.1 phospho-N-acetylmuramoyl-pentapeptide-transferase [Bacteroidales bacterium]